MEEIIRMTHKDVLEWIGEIRKYASEAGVKPIEADGLHGLLDVAHKLAEQKATDQDSQLTFQTVFMLWWSLERLARCQLDFSHQLRMLRQGSTTFGTQDTKESRYKGFEFELFVAATFCELGLIPEFCPPNDDFDIRVGDIYVECKQPDSADVVTIQGYVSDFNAKLFKHDKIGIFALGIEDMFSSARREHQNLDELSDLESELHKNINAVLAKVFIPFICSQRNVFGAITSWTIPVRVTKSESELMNFARLTNGMLVSKPPKFYKGTSKEYEEAKQIIELMPSHQEIQVEEISRRWFDYFSFLDRPQPKA